MKLKIIFVFIAIGLLFIAGCNDSVDDTSIKDDDSNPPSLPHEDSDKDTKKDDTLTPPSLPEE